MRHFALLAALLAGSAAAQPPQPASPCASADHEALDFWVGRWDVYKTGTDTKVADSLIERLYGGCAIRENWMPSSGTPGGRDDGRIVSASASTGRPGAS